MPTNPKDLSALRRSLLRVRPDSRALKASLQIPTFIALDQGSVLELTIETNRNDLTSLVIMLGAPADAVTFCHEGARLLGEEDLQIHADQQNMKIQSVGPDKVIRLAIPYSSFNRMDPLPARISIDYVNVSGPDRVRKYRTTQNINLALPVAVNVQDFFRPDRVISRFTVSSPGRHSLRIQSATLTAQEHGLKVTSFRQTNPEEDVTPESPVSYIFMVQRPDIGQGPDSDPRLLRLRVQYRTIEEEIRLIFRLLIETESSSTSSELQTSALNYLLGLLSKTRDYRFVSRYLETGKLGLVDGGDVKEQSPELQEIIVTVLKVSTASARRTQILRVSCLSLFPFSC